MKHIGVIKAGGYADKLEKMRLRRGECVRCDTPDHPPYPPCNCVEKSASIGAIMRAGKSVAGKAHKGWKGLTAGGLAVGGLGSWLGRRNDGAPRLSDAPAAGAVIETPDFVGDAKPVGYANPTGGIINNHTGNNMYAGHFLPAQFTPYGDGLRGEIAQASRYNEQNLADTSDDPRLDYDQYYKPMPLLAPATNQGLFMSPEGAAVLPPEAQAHHGAVFAGRSDAPAPVSMDEKSKFTAEQFTEPSSAEATNTHEWRHAATLSPDFPRSPFNRRYTGGGADTLRSQSDSSANHLSDYASLNHGLTPAEQLGWATGIQRDHFRRFGRRITDPQEARRIYSEAVNATPEKRREIFPWMGEETTRGIRHLRYLQQRGGGDKTKEYIESLGRIMPSLVRNSTPGMGKAAATRVPPRRDAYLAKISQFLRGTGATNSTTCEGGFRKQAAEMARKTRMVEVHDDHCPHCDHKFTEKGYPRPKLPENEKERRLALESGDYDEHCPACEGVIDQPDRDDAKLQEMASALGGDPDPHMLKLFTTQRDNQRRRKAEREKSASTHVTVVRRGEGWEQADSKGGKSPTPEEASGDVLDAISKEEDLPHDDSGRGSVKVEKPPPKSYDHDRSDLIGDLSDPFGKAAQQLIPFPGRVKRTVKGAFQDFMSAAHGDKLEHLSKAASLAAAVRKARKDTDQHATEAQIKAENYRKGRVNYKGLHIALENPKDSLRRGTSAAGKKWENRMSADYGYFTGAPGKSQPIAIDGDAVDVFIGPDLDSDLVVAIDQYFNGAYDETKFIVGVTTQEQGEQLYLSNYQKGWKLGPVSTTTVPQLKVWLKDPKKVKKPFKGQMLKAAAVADHVGRINYGK